MLIKQWWTFFFARWTYPIVSFMLTSPDRFFLHPHLMSFPLEPMARMRKSLQECWRSWKELVVYYVFPCPCIQSSSSDETVSGALKSCLNCWVGNSVAVASGSHIYNASRYIYIYMSKRCSKELYIYVHTHTYIYISVMYQHDSCADLCPGFWTCFSYTCDASSVSSFGMVWPPGSFLGQQFSQANELTLLVALNEDSYPPWN